MAPIADFVSGIRICTDKAQIAAAVELRRLIKGNREAQVELSEQEDSHCRSQIGNDQYFVGIQPVPATDSQVIGDDGCLSGNHHRSHYQHEQHIFPFEIQEGEGKCCQGAGNDLTKGDAALLPGRSLLQNVQAELYVSAWIKFSRVGCLWQNVHFHGEKLTGWHKSNADGI